MSFRIENSVIASASPRQVFADFWQFVSDNRAKVIALTLAYVSVLTVIGLQNVAYQDDALRRLTGDTMWGQLDGRWGSEFVAVFLNQGSRPLIDLGIASFIITGVILAAVSVILIYFLAGAAANWLSFAVALLVGLNPWYLAAAVFRYDGPLIAVGLLSAVIPLFFVPARPWVMIVAFLIVTIVTANFFQPLVGLILIGLLLRVLLDWLAGYLETRPALLLVGRAAIGVLIGGSIYLVQLALFSAARQTPLYDGAGTFGLNRLADIPVNFIEMIRQYRSDNTLLWLVIQFLAVAGFISASILISKRGLPRSLLAVLAVLGVSLVLAGGILLLADSPIINGRFLSPVAITLVMAAIASTVATQRHLAVVTRIALGALVFVWVSFAFVFGQALREQRDTLVFQTALITSDINAVRQPGDVLVYDPRIFQNSLYLTQIEQRFPIFKSYQFAEALRHGRGFNRYQINLMLGVEQMAMVQMQPVCETRPDPAQIGVAGPRWEVFRGTENVVCVVLPTGFAQVTADANGTLEVLFDLNTYPFDPGRRPGNAEHLSIAVWPVDNQANTQWAAPMGIYDGIAKFVIPEPPGGWTGDSVAIHFFADDEFVYQYIWLLQD